MRGKTLKTIWLALALGTVFSAQSAITADVQNGRRIAQLRCGSCHILGLSQRREVADSPPFAVIARKFSSNQEALIFAILNPHPRMNLSISRREADDIAAYINSLAR